jgi:preprotein translocase subunit SecG
MDKDLILLILFCIVGFFGDGILQLLSRYTSFGGDSSWGLKDYFIQHGVGESLCIATGLLAMFFIVYRFVLKFPTKWYYLVICSVILDFIFRKFTLFSSLDGYYAYFNNFWSAVGAALPALLPLVIYDVYKKTRKTNSSFL